jgi:hypothetical protein
MERMAMRRGNPDNSSSQFFYAWKLLKRLGCPTVHQLQPICWLRQADPASKVYRMARSVKPVLSSLGEPTSVGVR